MCVVNPQRNKVIKVTERKQADFRRYLWINEKKSFLNAAI